MTLKDLLEVLGSGEWLRIGTGHGRGWLFYNRSIHLYNTIPEDYLNRKVVNIYTVDERKGGNAIDLEEGVAIRVEGYENGEI